MGFIAFLGLAVLALKDSATPKPRAPTLGAHTLQAASATVVQRGPFPLEGVWALPTLAALALAPCSLAFVKTAYSFTYSYALSVALIGITLLIFAPQPADDTESVTRIETVPASPAQSATLQLAAQLHAALLVAYGVRLLAFLLQRSRVWPGWAEMVNRFEQASNGNLPPGSAANVGTLSRIANVLSFFAVRIGARLPLVVSLAAFYALMCSPALFHAQQPRAAPRRAASATLATTVTWVGLSICAAGLALEAFADAHKSAVKQANAGAFAEGVDFPVMSGPFAYVRHANYLGEMAFWLGSFLAGLPPTLAAVSALGAAVKALVASVGLGGIMCIMLGASRRLDVKQRAKYEDQKHPSHDAYASYCKRTPRLFPAPGLR